MEKPIAIGATAPGFNLKDNRGNMVDLNDYKGKKVLLSWHPLAWTSVCAEQMKAIEIDYARFEAFIRFHWGSVLILFLVKMLGPRNSRLPSLNCPRTSGHTGECPKPTACFVKWKDFLSGPMCLWMKTEKLYG